MTAARGSWKCSHKLKQILDLVFYACQSLFGNFRSYPSRAKHLHPVLQRQVRPLATPRQSHLRLAKDKLAVQLPSLGQTPSFPNLVHEIGHEVIMLGITTQALKLQGRPHDELMHAVGMLRPCDGLSARKLHHLRTTGNGLHSGMTC